MYKVIIPSVNNSPELNAEYGRTLATFETNKEAREYANAYYEKTKNDNICIIKR